MLSLPVIVIQNSMVMDRKQQQQKISTVLMNSLAPAQASVRLMLPNILFKQIVHYIGNTNEAFQDKIYLSDNMMVYLCIK